MASAEFTFKLDNIYDMTPPGGYERKVRYEETICKDHGPTWDYLRGEGSSGPRALADVQMVL